MSHFSLQSFASNQRYVYWFLHVMKQYYLLQKCFSCKLDTLMSLILSKFQICPQKDMTFGIKLRDEGAGAQGLPKAPLIWPTTSWWGGSTNHIRLKVKTIIVNKNVSKFLSFLKFFDQIWIFIHFLNKILLYSIVLY